jgi:long-chain acyl-CoA synthetase
MLKSIRAEKCMNYRNLIELHRLQAEALGPRPAIRHKRDGLYRDLSWEDYRARSLACAAALVEAGVQVGDRVGLLAENRWEWLITDMAVLTAGGVNVTPHSPLTARQVHFQFADAGVSWLFVSSREQMDKVRSIRGELPKLRGVVAFDRDALRPDAIWWPGFVLQGQRALARLAGELERREKAITADDLATLMYTSGTTGDPKGVMLTHRNLLSNACATEASGPRGSNSLVLNWLPLSHIYARLCDHYVSIVAGATVALAESVDTIVQNLQELWPTHMASVPRFYEKLLAMVSGPDPTVTAKKLRGIFGPRMEWLSSGGAPLPPAVAHAYQALGINVLQGYGLTETSPVLSFNRKEHFKLETVGQAIPGVELKIAEDGEILARGPNIMKGYWNDPKGSSEALKGGWFHTGDLGRLDDEGFLTITGRKKELMVLSSGKKIVPPQIEGLLLAEPCIDQVVVYGEGRNFLSALIVPQWANIRKFLPNLAGESDETLAKNPAVRQLLDSKIQAALKDVAGWERVKEFVIVPRPFSVAADEVTVSQKLRRNVIIEHHKTALEKFYAGSDGAARDA